MLDSFCVMACYFCVYANRAQEALNYFMSAATFIREISANISEKNPTIRFLENQPFFRKSLKHLGHSWLSHTEPAGNHLALVHLKVPKRAVRRGYDRVRLLPAKRPTPWRVLAVSPTATPASARPRKARGLKIDRQPPPPGDRGWEPAPEAAPTEDAEAAEDSEAPPPGDQEAPTPSGHEAAPSGTP